jgi:hypothetical protein
MRSPSQNRFTLIALVAFCFFILAGCAAQLFGQTNDGKMMIQVFNDDGPATVYYVTPENSKAIGVNSSGIPAMLSVSGSSNLAGLTDVAITSLANLDLLRYDSATSKWKSVPGSTYALSSALSDYLTTANAASTYQPLDSDLTAIAALNPTFGQVLRRGASAWIATTPGSMFLQNANNVAITGGTITGLTALDLSAFGITTQEATILPTTGEARLTLEAGGGNAVLFYTGTNSPFYQLRDQATGGFLVSTGDSGSVTNDMLASGISASKLAAGSATNGQALVYNGTNWAPGTISTGLTIGSTGITGGTSGRFLMSGANVSELTPGSGVVTWIGAPSLANFNAATTDADAATTGANTFTGAQVVNAGSGFTGRILDAQVAGVTKAHLTHDGRIVLSADTFNNFSTPVVQTGSGRGLCTTGGSVLNLAAGGADCLGVSPTSVNVGSGQRLGFSSGSAPGAGNPDAFFMRAGTASISMGANAASPVPQTFKAHDGIGTNIDGAPLILAGGLSTGTGNDGDLIVQTTMTGASSGSTANSYQTRQHFQARFVNLTEATATNVTSISLASGRVTGGTATVTVWASDGTDHQTLTSEIRFGAVNKAGTLTTTANQTDGVVAASAGTLTATYDTAASGNNLLIRANATSSLTQTVLRCRIVITALNGDDVQTVTPQ